MIGKIIISVAVFSITACVHTENRSTPNITFSSLKSLYANYNNEIKKARPSLAFDNATTASNCMDYFSVQKVANPIETGSNFLVAQEYLICDTLATIKNATLINKAPDSKYVNISVGVHLANKVDLRTFRSSLYQRADEKIYTLATMLETSVSTEE